MLASSVPRCFCLVYLLSQNILLPPVLTLLLRSFVFWKVPSWRFLDIPLQFSPLLSSKPVSTQRQKEGMFCKIGNNTNREQKRIQRLPCRLSRSFIGQVRPIAGSHGHTLWCLGAFPEYHSPRCPVQHVFFCKLKLILTCANGKQLQPPKPPPPSTAALSRAKRCCGVCERAGNISVRLWASCWHRGTQPSPLAVRAASSNEVHAIGHLS